MSDQNATKLHGLAFTAYAEGVRRETPGAQLTVLELQNQIANTAERFIVAARWLAEQIDAGCRRGRQRDGLRPGGP